MADQNQMQPVSRKRSHSVMSQQDGAIQVAMNSRAPSIHSQPGASPNEEYSPRGSRAFKRGDPPTNGEGKYICDFAEECIGQIFDRKCEWSKHMDKHDRPYRCPDPSCAKLQGFTYSGGLLRHEREVHGKHGGPKAQLMCPHLDCKRHTGKGFTRKENLNEHLRRVHSGKDQSQTQDSQQDPMLGREGLDVMTGAENHEHRPEHMSVSDAILADQLANTSPALGNKRKRSMGPVDEHGLPEDVEDLKLEIKRLRAEGEAKDDHIRQMEAAAAEQAEVARRLEETVMRLQQQNGAPQAPIGSS